MAADLLAAALADQPSELLIDTYRDTDAAWLSYTPEERAAAAAVRGALTDELGRRYPAAFDAWCDALDAGDDPDLMDLFAAAARSGER